MLLPLCSFLRSICLPGLWRRCSHKSLREPHSSAQCLASVTIWSGSATYRGHAAARTISRSAARNASRVFGGMGASNCSVDGRLRIYGARIREDHARARALCRDPVGTQSASAPPSELADDTCGGYGRACGAARRLRADRGGANGRNIGRRHSHSAPSKRLQFDQAPERNGIGSPFWPTRIRDGPLVPELSGGSRVCGFGAAFNRGVAAPRSGSGRPR